MPDFLASMRPVDWAILVTNIAVIVQGLAIMRIGRR